MSDHPSPRALEAWQADRQDEAVTAHVAACGGCSTYVRDLEKSQAEFLSRAVPEDFVREVRRSIPDPRPARRWLSILAPALAVACAALLFVAVGTDRTTSSVSDTIRSKGSFTLAAIVLRGGEQQRLTGPEVDVRPNDRVRFELTVPKAGEVSVAVIEANGPAYLLQRERLEPGTRYLERTFRVDDRPTRARVVAGPDEEVRRALESKRYDRVATLVLVSEGAPP